LKYIYTLSDPRTGDVRYIGKANNPKKRFYSHKAEKNTRTRKYFWIRSLQRQGLEPIIDVLEEFPEESGDTLWPAAETYWIAMFKFWGYKLTNHDSGGNSGFQKNEITRRKIAIAKTGVKITEETREKMRLSHVGKKQSAETIEKRAALKRGVPRDEETRRKISAANMGKPKSAQARERMRIAQTGKTLPAEVRAKLSAKNLGRVHTPESIEKIRQGHLGKSNPAKGNGKRGIQLSEETRAKISAAQLGKTLSAEHRGKIGLSSKGHKRGIGRKASPEHREKIRLAGLGRIHSEESKRLMSEKVKAAWIRRRAAKLAQADTASKI